MGTYYIPNSDGWKESHSYDLWLRFKVTTSYNKSTNQSSVTLIPQVWIGSDNLLQYDMGNTSYLKANGQTLIAATGSDDSGNGYTFSLTSTGWHDMGGTSGFSFTVDHDDTGRASISVEAKFRLYSVNYSTTNQFRSWQDSGSTSWSEERVKYYTLIISAGEGSTVSVTRAGVTLLNGASIKEADTLTVNFGAAAGYTLASQTVNGVTTASGSTVTVAGNVTVAATATAVPYKLRINAGTGAEISVQRISSPKQGAALGALTDGAAIYDGDVIRATAEAATGYILTSATLNGNAIPANHTVNSDVTVAAAAEEYVDPVERHTLTISTGAGATATVIRSNEKLISGSVLSAGDVLSVYFAPETGYVLETSTVNGSPFVSGGTVTVSGDVAVAATATEEKKVSVTVGDLWHAKPTFAQWESDRLLVISGTDKAPFLRFAICALPRALVVKAEYSGSDWLCKVPNIMLQFAGDMVVSVVVEEDTGETREIASAAYRVKPRVKPQDYEYTENIGYINWVAKSEEAEQLLERLRIAAEANATAADSAAQAADSALDAETQAGFAREAAADAEARKEAAAESAAAAALSATQAAESAASASSDKTSAEDAAQSARVSAAYAEAARTSAEDDAFSASQYAGYANTAKYDAQAAQAAAEAASAAAGESAESAEEAAAHYPRVANGEWQVWDVQAQDWAGTGVNAQGEQGEQGEKGDTGETPDFRIGTVSTLEAGQQASASITGTALKPRLNLEIPRGDRGEQGEKGDTGEQGPKGDPGEVTQVEFDELAADVGDLKSAFYNDSAHFQDTGMLLLTRGQFGRDVYNPNTGAIGTTRPYRISSRVPIVFPFDVTLTASDGFQFYNYTWDGTTWRNGSWRTEFTLSANTQYHIQISRAIEDTSEIANITTFIDAITVSGGIFNSLFNDVSSIKTDINNINSDIIDLRDEKNVLPIAVSFEQGRYAYCKKQEDTARIRSVNPIYVHIGEKVIVYSPTLYTYVGLAESLDSTAYLQSSGWKHQDTTMVEYTFVADHDGYIIINVAKPDKTSAIIPSEFDGYVYISKNHNIPGKHLHVYQFGGNGNDWCFVRTPVGYNPARAKPYPFVICNHGNSWVMDGTIEKANWTKRTMYIPSTDPDAGGTQFNVTDDQTLWYSNPTIEALLTAGYIVCGCENYADNMYGNNNCRNACVDFFYHMTRTYNVEIRCYMIGASNGAMTSLNAAYLLQGAVKAMILQYPLTCLVNQYESHADHQAGIRTAYGITDTDITTEELAIAVATHDPLTVDVVDGKKVGVFPPTAIYYSQSDAVVDYQQNAIALTNMLTASNKVVKTVQCTGQHGDKSMFVPTDFVAWFNAN